MKQRLVLACWLAGLALVAFAVLTALLDTAARPYVYGGLAGVLALVLAGMLLYVRSYPHWVAFQAARHTRRGQVHEHQAREHAAAVRGYELVERREKWALEKAKLQAEISRLLSQVPANTYVRDPEADPSDLSESAYLFLPPAFPVRGPGGAGGVTVRPGRTAAQMEQDELNAALPTHVSYEEIRYDVPRKHVLVGVGLHGLVTREAAVGACVWIVGLSGTGKTSTTRIRVEERRCGGHKFLIGDPHWFKPDSLLNALEAYTDDFLMPAGRSAEEILAVLQAFRDEFAARKGGEIAQPWQPITLIIDEVGSLMDKAAATTPEEREIIELLPSIARICGQEARNFAMSGIFISQQATGLAWLRKVATMIIVHQLLMESEKRLALNGDAVVMDAMKRWPIGRTYVYGVGFGKEGPMTVQQPFFGAGGQVEDEGEEDLPEDETCMEALQPRTTRVIEQDPVAEETPGPIDPYSVLDEGEREALVLYDRGAGPREIERSLLVTYHRARMLWLGCKDFRALYPVESEEFEAESLEEAESVDAD